jgi:hypothetical protein
MWKTDKCWKIFENSHNMYSFNKLIQCGAGYGVKALLIAWIQTERSFCMAL